MADEKFVASQRDSRTDLMVKEVILHEDIETKMGKADKETGEILHFRNSLINPRRSICLKDENIYDRVNSYINSSYDTEKIKTLYLMGDGGSWIVPGKDILKSYSYPVKCGIDKYHLSQTVNAISDDEEEKKQLYHLAIGNRRKKFDTLISEIIKRDKDREDTIKEKAGYITNHFKEIQTMYKEIKIGCAVEQAISHDLSSQFTSVPKAYSNKWLGFYLNIRENYLNSYDLRRSYLMSLDRTESLNRENEADLSEHLITSFSDSQIKDETYILSKKPQISRYRN